ncbi:MAG: Z1 domain-containing protein [Malacoplasma sp.]
MSDYRNFITSFLVEENAPTSKFIKQEIFNTPIIDDFIKWNVDNIFSFDNLSKARIICVGQVQSGKTINIIKCIERAMQKNYDCIIVFGGINKILLKQTNNRVKQQLGNKFSDFGYTQLYPDQYSEIAQLIKKKTKLVICITKENTALKSIANQIKKNIIGKDTKFLIIDDESDYGTINSGANEYDNSAFYKYLEEIYNELQSCKLLYFTATPYGNILSDKKTKSDEPKIVVLKNSNEYFGIDKSMTLNNFYLSNQKINKEIISDDSQLRQLIFLTITIYLIGASQLKMDNPTKGDIKSQCLINLSSATDDHYEHKYKVEKIISDFVDYSDFEIKNIIIKTISGWNINCDFCNQNEDFQNKFIEHSKEIINYIKDNKSFYTLNGKAESGKGDFLEKTFNHEIIIGGVMLSRGVTFENLIIELIVNDVEMVYVDTLLQRCRWFGYRNNISKYMKIIIPARIYEALKIAKKYVNLFSPGIQDYEDIKRDLIYLDQESNNVKGTRHDKSHK